MAGAVITLCVLGVVLLVSYFWLPRSSVVHGVEVLTDAEVMRCTGTDVETVTDTAPGVNGFSVDIADIRPDMDCRLRFLIDNTTSHDVQLTRIAFPIYRGQGGPGVVVTGLNPSGLSGSSSRPSGDLDTEFVLDDRLTAGERRSFEAVLEFQESGCSSPGSTISIPPGRWPTVTVRFHHMDLDLDPATEAFGFSGTEFTDCDSSLPSEAAPVGT